RPPRSAPGKLSRRAGGYRGSADRSRPYKFRLLEREPEIYTEIAPKSRDFDGLGDRLGDLGSLREDDDAALRDVVALPILFDLEADLRARRDVDPLVGDDAPETRVAPHLDAVHQHAFLDVRVGIDSHAREQDRSVNRAAR